MGNLQYLFLCLVLALTVWSVKGAPPPGLELPAVDRPLYCTHDNKQYMIGQSFQTDACTFCNCDANAVSTCNTIGCEQILFCTNGAAPVKRYGECCPECPETVPMENEPAPAEQ